MNININGRLIQVDNNDRVALVKLRTELITAVAAVERQLEADLVSFVKAAMASPSAPRKPFRHAAMPHHMQRKRLADLGDAMAAEAARGGTPKSDVVNAEPPTTEMVQEELPVVVGRHRGRKRVTPGRMARAILLRKKLGDIPTNSMLARKLGDTDQLVSIATTLDTTHMRALHKALRARAEEIVKEVLAKGGSWEDVDPNQV